MPRPTQTTFHELGLKGSAHFHHIMSIGLQRFYAKDTKSNWREHGIFGKLTPCRAMGHMY
jgi:hypothetical protein